MMLRIMMMTISTAIEPDRRRPALEIMRVDVVHVHDDVGPRGYIYMSHRHANHKKNLVSIYLYCYCCASSIFFSIFW